MSKSEQHILLRYKYIVIHTSRPFPQMYMEEIVDSNLMKHTDNNLNVLKSLQNYGHF